MKWAFYGSSLTSAYWNGAATYWRGIIHALAKCGHDVTFYEPDTLDRQKHRDMADPPWAKVVVYPCDDERVVRDITDDASDYEVLVKCSGVGIYDQALESAVLAVRREGQLAIYWDVDAPATLHRLETNRRDALRDKIPRYDLILTYGGGEPVIREYPRWEAAGVCLFTMRWIRKRTIPLKWTRSFVAHLSFLGNRLPDREARVDEFFFKAARQCPEHQFLIGGSGWADKDELKRRTNINYVGHVYTREHNAFNSSPIVVLNISRESMARCGYSPATRVFEAAGAGACVITDAWPGVNQFLEPESEVLVAHDGDAVASYVRTLKPEQAQAIGSAARRRILREHTYEQRVRQIEQILSETQASRRRPEDQHMRTSS